MASFEDLAFSTDHFTGKVRLFPLPNFVLFPHVMQPLHIFEPRYRDMLEDALVGDRLLAMALLAPGWEKNYEGRPPIYPMACLGRIITHFRLPDGTYNILVMGLQRVKLLYEIESKQRFREARVEVHEDFYPSQEIDRYDCLFSQLRKAFTEILPHLPEAYEQLDQLLDSEISLGMLTDIISYMLDADTGKKQELLTEHDVYRRAEMLINLLSIRYEELAESELGSKIFPPLFSNN